MIFLGVTILGLVRHKIHFFSFFIPAGTPIALVPLLALIELISYFARAFSLGVRSNGCLSLRNMLESCDLFFTLTHRYQQPAGTCESFRD